MTEITTEDEIEQLVKQSLDKQKTLMLYNDDVNTFEGVIDCLIKYCKHSSEQSEQIALLVHYTGKAEVKRGDFDLLLPIYTALLDNKLNVKIE